VFSGEVFKVRVFGHQTVGIERISRCHYRYNGDYNDVKYETGDRYAFNFNNSYGIQLHEEKEEKGNNNKITKH